MADYDDETIELPAGNFAPDGEEGQGDIGDYLMLPAPADDEITAEDQEDGSTVFTMGEVEDLPTEDGGFYANLAEVIPENILTTIACDLIKKVDEDKESRKDGDKKYEEGIRRTGLGDDAPGGAEFEGASKVVHPMMTEACIDYEARIIKELWPVGQPPVRQHILGDVTKEKVERAKRKVSYMSWQLTHQIKEARDETESMLTQVPLGGAQYLKLWWDERLHRPSLQFISRDYCYIPKNAGSWYAARRRTVRDELSAVEIKERMGSGLYREIDLPSNSIEPEPSGPEEASRKVEGLTPTGLNVDSDREVYEVMAYLEVSPEMAQILAHEEEGAIYPYLVTIDVQTKKVLAIYRDWEEDDQGHEPIDHVFEFPFIPWRGAYAIGLPQIIGGLSGGATGSLRALLDSAMLNNAQTGLMLEGSLDGGSRTIRPKIGEMAQIKGGGGATPDIRQRVMMLNPKEPSGVLFQLLGFMVEAGKGAVRTSLDEMNQDGNPNVPVGTQLSRVEEGLVVFSAAHGRIHVAFDRLLKGLHRINRMYLPDEPITVDAGGTELFISRQDFTGPVDVMPVSDPTIYSDQQRMAQMQAIISRSDTHPEHYQGRKVEKRFLDLMKIQDADELLTPEDEPVELNAVNENVSMSFGKPVTVFPDQDHVSHILTHLSFMTSPAFGANPLIAPKYLPPALEHIAQHIVFQYAKWSAELVGMAAGRPPSDLMGDHPQVKAALDKLLFLASAKVVPYATQLFQQIAPALQQSYALLQQFKPPQPVDPTQVALQSAQAETARRAKSDQVQGALAAAKQQQQGTSDQQKNAIAAERNRITEEGNQMRTRAELARTAMEAASARNIAEMKIESGQPTQLSDGAGLAG